MYSLTKKPFVKEAESKKLSPKDQKRVTKLTSDLGNIKFEIEKIVNKYFAKNLSLIVNDHAKNELKPELIFFMDANGHCGVYDEETGECSFVRC